MPETGLGESRTAAFIAEELRGLGPEVITGLGGNGVVALLRGASAANDAPFIGLRTEPDALPMRGPADGTEQTRDGSRPGQAGLRSSCAPACTVPHG